MIDQWLTRIDIYPTLWYLVFKDSDYVLYSYLQGRLISVGALTGVILTRVRYPVGASSLWYCLLRRSSTTCMYSALQRSCRPLRWRSNCAKPDCGWLKSHVVYLQSLLKTDLILPSSQLRIVAWSNRPIELLIGSYKRDHAVRLRIQITWMPWVQPIARQVELLLQG